MIGSAASARDVITSYSKKTVEIMDTDAEGRLIMADALSYSGNYKPCCVIDVSTLMDKRVLFLMRCPLLLWETMINY